ncbi:MAG: hypothetical protein K8R53_12485 [Bacteroidales bacterium]|nr:hypothetical protein [Bacteroidales bacterium]
MKISSVNNQVLATITKSIRNNVSENDVIIADEGINQNLDLYGKWKLADISFLNPPPAALTQFDNKQPQGIPPNRKKNIDARKKYTKLTGHERAKTFLLDAFNWSGRKGKVYMLAEKSKIENLACVLFPQFNLKWVTWIELPEQNRSTGFKPAAGSPGHPGPPSGPGRIFDLRTDTKELWLVQWIRI